MENNMWTWTLSTILLMYHCRESSQLNLEGPELLRHPPPVTYFSNSVGVTLECVGRGHPPLSTKWLTADGNLLTEIPGLREIGRNNSLLHLLPFRGEDFLASVHDSRYRCSIQNPIGTILSPTFAVRYVIDAEPFEMFITSAVEDGETIEGNPAVLNCDVKPAIYKDFVKVIHWKFIDQYGHETEIESNGNMYISSTGSLLILGAKYQQLFICVALNRLNNKIQSSAPFMLKSKAGAGNVPSPLTSAGKWQRMIFTEIGKQVDLLSLSMGNPSPNFRWEKLIQETGKYVPVVVDPKVRILGPLMSFDEVTTTANGTYRVEVYNAFSSFFLETDLIVTAEPRVELLPHKMTLHTGQNVELKCETTPDVANHAEITWFYNGRRLFGGGDDDGSGDTRMRIALKRLSILNIRYEDQGVYQCFMQFGIREIGGSSNLVFPSFGPELMHTFISQTLQPGPLVSLKCSAIGNPIPIISWYVDGNLLLSPTTTGDQGPWRESNHHYSSGSHVQMNEIVSYVNISNIRVEDSGEWKCIATNLLSSAIHSARLNIYGKPFVKDMGHLTLVAGTIALIPCKHGGYPIDKLVWRKNGSEIDTRKNKSRFRTLANGSLEIENIKPGSDKGQYSCTVSNRKGESASGSVSINVLRPPVITQFIFDDNLQEGQRTSISCNVMSGDLPIDITWSKDSKDINDESITPMRVKFLSNLIFEELKGSHSGVYTCSASNAASTVKFSAHLIVKVPPSWSHEPTDSRVLLKSDLVIPCHAIGMPQPRIMWFSESPITRTAIRPDHKFRISENGSLLLLDVEKSSNFTCEASNGIGNGIQKSIRVSVMVPAEVSVLTKSVMVAEGLPVLLRAIIRGNFPVEVVWRKNTIVIEQSPRIVVQTVLDANYSSGDFFAELKISDSEISDSGTYHCIGFNQYGRDEEAISLQVKARPRPPNGLSVAEIGSRFIQLNWFLNTENLSSTPVTHFLLQYKNSSAISWGSDGVNNVTVQAPANTAILRSLNPVTYYEIRILALNEYPYLDNHIKGLLSLPSQPISVSTLPEAPSGPPLNVSAIYTNPRTVLVNWEQPHAILQNGAILGYHVLVTPVSISTISSNNTKLIDEKWGTQTEIHELRPNSRYHISVRAYNVAGVGPESPYVFISTPEGAPDSPPVNVRCDPLSPKSLQVVWEPPPQHLTNGIIQGYKVIYSPAESELRGEKPEIKKTGNRETTLHGLHSYTNYSIRTLVYTLGGESLLSDEVFCKTIEDLPGQPADIKVLPSGPNSVLVSWLPPRFPNGIITKYRISWRSEDLEGEKERYYTTSGNWEDQMLLEVRRLRDNKRYTFSVSAATSLGHGKPSESVDVTVLSKVRASIASFPVTRKTKLDQSVSLPCRSVGFPLPDITWLRGSSPYTLNHIMRNGTLLIPRVKDQDEGVYSCVVENGLGSDEIQHTIVLQRPPSSVSLVLGYVTINSIQIHWDPSSRPADPSLTGYILQYRSGSMLEWNFHRLGPRLNSFVMDNLLCGTEYQIRLALENSIGLGEFSQVLKTKTNGAPPEHPKLTEIIDGNGTMIRIDLSRCPNGGCPIKKFHLEFKNKASGEWKTIHRANFSQVFILNTTLGSKYDIKISLENEAGHASKTFSVESSPQFFTNYDEFMQNNGDQTVISGSALLSDPHIIVPAISALICTIAVIICIFIVIKRNDVSGDRWKLGNSSSQQTWLSSDDFRIEKTSDKSKIEEVPGNSGGMSIYATLNSRQSIPLTIRDSTVRFQTFGQVENYDAPPPRQPCYGRTTGNFNSSLSHEELVMQEGFAPNHKAHDSLNLQAIRNLRRVSNPNEYSLEDICSHDYAHPYQVVPVIRDPMNSDQYGRNTLRKQKQDKRNRRYPDQLN